MRLKNIIRDFSRIDEVHYADTYPQGFVDFRKRYMALSRKGDGSDLYVQFTSKDNALDRTAVATPDHRDPVGVYAYPLSYVLSHPADVWYGRGARYLRVLKDTSNNKLRLTRIENETEVSRLLRKMGFNYEQVDQMIKTARKTYKGRYIGKTKFAKLFMTAAQIDLLSTPEMDTYDRPVYRVRTGAEQTALFRAAGFDAIEDTSRTHAQAVINDREPEQIIFLTRGAFRVVEVIPLRPLGHVRQGPDDDAFRSKLNRLDRDLPSMVAPTPDTPRVERPFVATIAKLLGDEIKEGPERSSLNGWSYYWTKKGRRIEIRFEVHDGYFDGKKFGQKNHRSYKLHDQYKTSIKIKTEFGDIFALRDTRTQFKDILRDLASDWRSIQASPKQTDWTPEDRSGFHAKREAEQSARIQAEIDKEKRMRLRELPRFLNDVKWVADHYGLPFTPNDDFELNEFLMKSLEYFKNVFSRGMSLDEVIVFITDDFDAPVTKPLRPQWEQISDVIRAAWPEMMAHEDGWIIKRGGSNMFENIRRILKGVGFSGQTPDYEPV